MSKFNIDYERVFRIKASDVRSGPYVLDVVLWNQPPEGISYEGAINMMHERTLELAKMLETIINVLPELPVVSLPKGQRPGSDGFKL